MKDWYQFSLAAQDESARARIRAVKEKYGTYRKMLNISARRLSLFSKRNIPEMSQILAKGYYLILDAAGWDAKHEECAF
jgi:hypothetical protein